MNETFIPASSLNKRKWYVIDCKEQKLGRICSLIIGLLSGKIKSNYHPAFDTGDYVILINADSILFNREQPRFHVYKPGRPGKSLKRVTKILPKRIIERCIFGMMPNGTAKRNLPTRLKIYSGAEHPHAAQNPVFLDTIENLTTNI